MTVAFKLAFIIGVLALIPLNAANPQRKPTQTQSIEAELEEEEKNLSKEEEDFLKEEYTAPKEAPYAEEPATEYKQPAPVKGPEQPAQPEYKAYNMPETPYNQSGLKKVTAKGEYIYQVPKSPQKWSSKLRVGPFSPPDLVNDLGPGKVIGFEDVYGTTANLMYTIDVEYQVFKSLGKLGLRLGTGFYTATGSGRFNNNINKVAREEYSFYLAPNSLDLVYYLDFIGTQFLVPYAFGGGYYFTFLETRDDNAPAKYGGALAANFGGGIAIKIDGLDRTAINQMDADYGINHIYFVGEFEQIVGLNTTFDFTNQFITGGIRIEY